MLELARICRGRLTSLVAHWMRVGYCQGNFNSDNCAAGGYTLDYGTFGFCELFDPRFQPWTGGGEHFCFFNQPAAAEVNYGMFWRSLQTLLESNSDALEQLNAIKDHFAGAMAEELETMWSSKLGLRSYDAELMQELLQLLVSSRADYTIFFRRLSTIPQSVEDLKTSFYLPSSEELDQRWQAWLQRWRQQITNPAETAAAMQRVNPAVTWREWMIAPAYEQAAEGNFSLIR